MKRLRLTVTGLGLVMLMMMGIVVQSQFAPYSAFAQPAPTHATPVLGDYGYTYNIQPTLSVFSVYNVWGEAKSEIINGISHTRFQTYAVRQQGAVVSSFQNLRLRGRVYWRGETGCPLNLFRQKSRHWKGGSGQKDVWFLDIPNPDDYWERTAIGKHKLVHPGAYTLATPPASPSYFYVAIWDNENPANLNTWNGQGLGCPPLFDPPPDPTDED